MAKQERYFYDLTTRKVRERWGGALCALSETIQEELRLAEAARTVLAQLAAEYKPARELIRDCLNVREES